MVAHLNAVGINEPNERLKLWQNIENNSVVDLRQDKRHFAHFFLDAVRA